MIARQADPLMTPGEVGRLFGVEAKTVSRWAKAGVLPCIRTPGGHNRFRRSVVEETLRAQQEAEA